MKYLSILLFVLLTPLMVNAQLGKVEFTAGINKPIIPEIVEDSHVNSGFSGVTGYQTVSTGKLTESYNTDIGMAFQAMYKVQLGKKISVKSGVGISKVRFTRSFKTEPVDELEMDGSIIGWWDGSTVDTTGVNYGSIIGYPYSRDSTLVFLPRGDYTLVNQKYHPIDIYYVSIPVLIDYQLNSRLSAYSGLQLMNRVFSKTKRNQFGYNPETGETTFEEVEDTSGDGLNEAQVAVVAGFSAKVWQNLGVNISFERSLTSIYQESAFSKGRAKYIIINFGISYSLSL